MSYKKRDGICLDFVITIFNSHHRLGVKNGSLAKKVKTSDFLNNKLLMNTIINRLYFLNEQSISEKIVATF